MDRAPIRTATLGTRVALAALAIAAAAGAGGAWRAQTRADAASGDAAELRRQLTALQAAPPRVVAAPVSPCLAPAVRPGPDFPLRRPARRRDDARRHAGDDGDGR